MISARLRRRSERIRKRKKHTIVFHLCSCQGATAGAESAEAQRSVARIELDTEMWPKRVSSPEAGDRPKGTPAERKTPRGRNGTLGKYDERQETEATKAADLSPLRNKP